MEVGKHLHYSKLRRFSSRVLVSPISPENATVERPGNVTARSRENATAESSINASGESSTASKIAPGPSVNSP